MRTFTDTFKSDWSLDLNIGAIKRVKSLTGVDLLEARDGKVLIDIAEDPVRMADVLYAICQPQAATRNINDEAFGERLDGETARKAIEAFTAELIDFFLHFRPEIGKVLATLWAKVASISAEAPAIAVRKMESPEMDAAIREVYQRIEAKIDEDLARSLGKISTRSPE